MGAVWPLHACVGYGGFAGFSDMNILDAVRRSVRHYPGGLEAVALRLGKSASTLEKELRGAPGFKLGAEDAAEIAAMCCDVGSEFASDFPAAVAERVRAHLLFLPERVSDAKTVQEVAQLMRECADVVSAATLAAADGVITRNELKGVRLQWSELVAVGQELMRHLEAQHEAGKPAA